MEAGEDRSSGRLGGPSMLILAGFVCERILVRLAAQARHLGGLGVIVVRRLLDAQQQSKTINAK